MTQSLAFRYVEAFGAACRECNIKDFSLVQGASEEDLNRLREKFPDVPETLIQFLSLVDGTYYRKYNGKEVCVAVFDGVDGDIPYYLNSVEQILKQNAPSIAAMYGDPDPEDRASPEYLSEFMDMVGEGIDPFQPFGNMLHLSDCTNNGGSSALYNEATVYDFTFIVSLRLEKSLELLAHIDAMLTEEAGKKACASLVRLLKKKIKEAKA